MKPSQMLSFLTFGVMVAYAVSYITGLGVRFGPPDDRTNISMQVADINGLVADSNVLLRGVPVGKVTSIDTNVQGATIHFYVTREHPIPIDSDVKLENLSALGESYIGLVPRSSGGPVFRDGAQVNTQDIHQPASISELAASFVRVLNQMDPQQLNGIIDEADIAFPKPDAVLPNLVRAGTLLRNTVNGMNGAGAQMLTNFQTLLRNAGFVGSDLSQIAPALLALGTPLNQLFIAAYNVVVDTGAPEGVKNFGRFLARIQNFLDARAPDLKVFAEAFTPNINGIAAAAMNVDTGQILSNILDALPEDGTITLRLITPNP